MVRARIKARRVRIRARARVRGVRARARASVGMIAKLRCRICHLIRSIKIRGHGQYFKGCIRLRESQQGLIRTAKGVLGGKARALGSIHARSRLIRCSLASTTYTYLVDVFSIPDNVSERPSSTTNLHFFALLCL